MMHFAWLMVCWKYEQKTLSQLGVKSISTWVGKVLSLMEGARLSCAQAQAARRCFGVFSCLMGLLCGCTDQTPRAPSLADFGPVAIYQPHTTPKGIVLVLSDDAGWTPERDAFGKHLAAVGYLVGGIDSRPYLERLSRDQRSCVSLANDLALLARHPLLQHTPAYPIVQSAPPVWLGIGEGAAVVYAAAAQAPVDQVHAAVSLNFCPQLAAHVNLCATDGFEVAARANTKTVTLAPRPRLAIPWFIFQERSYPECALTSVRNFADQIANARFVMWPSDRQSTKNSLNGEAQALIVMKLLDPRTPYFASSSEALSDLRLFETRATHDPNDYLAVFLTGDGGWAALDKGVAEVLTKHHISTVGWDSLAYYWKPRTPKQAASDLARLVRYYLNAWQKQRLLLIGYSSGAEVLPFLINRLPGDLRHRIDAIALLGLSKTATFEFHFAEWWGGTSAARSYPVAPELAQLPEAPIVCIYGENETASLCPALHLPIQVAKVPGDHHFNYDYTLLVSHILDLVPELHSGLKGHPVVVTQ